MTELRRLRKARNFSREELAVRSGVAWTTIRAHERGEVNGVETKTAEKLAEALEVDVRELFFAPITDKSDHPDIPEGSAA